MAKQLWNEMVRDCKSRAPEDLCGCMTTKISGLFDLELPFRGEFRSLEDQFLVLAMSSLGEECVLFGAPQEVEVKGDIRPFPGENPEEAQRAKSEHARRQPIEYPY